MTGLLALVQGVGRCNETVIKNRAPVCRMASGGSPMESEELRRTTERVISAPGADITMSLPAVEQLMNRRLALPAQFLNRELGILAFNRRVLAQAADDSVPLLERLRFITI